MRGYAHGFKANGRLVKRDEAITAIAKIMPLQNSGILEQFDGAVNGGDRYAVIHRRAAAMKLLDIGMIVRRGQHARDDAALLGHAHPLSEALGLDIRRFHSAHGHVFAHTPSYPQIRSRRSTSAIQGTTASTGTTVNQNGDLRGNYTDAVTDHTLPIHGKVDQKTQRAAWTIGKKNDRVFETGIYNLTKPESPVLVHFGSDRTQQWLLVRVDQPKQ
jgi:hypothetical protein